jgi:hypothetical protein
MATIVSNLEQVIKRLEGKLKFINGEDTNLPGNVITEIAKTIYKNTIQRIFINGLSTNHRKIGKYAKSYKKLRAKKGLQTTFVDLTFTGHLKTTYQLKKKGSSYIIGFTDPGSVRIAGYMEQKFKCKIFALTDKDVTAAEKIIQNWVKKVNSGK